jgi:hypothetical protein
LHLQVEWVIPAPQDPRMKIWCGLMSRHVTDPIVKYNDPFFDWLRPQLLMVDGYVYDDLEFRGDLDLVLLEGSQWGKLGKNHILFL